MNKQNITKIGPSLLQAAVTAHKAGNIKKAELTDNINKCSHINTNIINIEQLIYDNGGKLWTAVSAFHIVTTCFYLYVLSSWDGLQDLVESKSKTLEWVQTRKINLVGMMTALLVVVSALTVFFYIEIVTKPVIG